MRKETRFRQETKGNHLWSQWTKSRPHLILLDFERNFARETTTPLNFFISASNNKNKIANFRFQDASGKSDPHPLRHGASNRAQIWLTTLLSL